MHHAGIRPSVLAVDDDGASRMLSVLTLEHCGFPVAAADRGEAAIEAVRADLHSPTRLAGQECVSSAAIGLAAYPRAGDHANTLLRYAAIAMAKSLQLRGIAEGVETGAQLRLLRAHGCHIMQGRCFSRPVPAADFVRLRRESAAQAAAPLAPARERRRAGAPRRATPGVPAGW